MQIIAIVVSLLATGVAAVVLTKAVREMLAVIRTGGPTEGRTDNPAARTVTMLKETFLHTRMLQWTWVGAMHWFAFAAFLFLSSAVAAGFVQLFNPYFEIPVVGRWYIYGWTAEILGLLGTLSIIPLIIYRQLHKPSNEGRKSRFFGSRMGQAYFVEFMVLLESAAILFIRGAEYKLHAAEKLHFPLSHLVGEWFYPDSIKALENIVFFVAMVKVTSAMIWLIVIGLNLTMGIAWHRFLAWPNIWFKRESSGRTALGALKPLTAGGKPVTLDDIEEMDEDTVLGVGKIEDFSWKDILDFTTCTECGRCQSQCPAWNTEKPLSPKLLMMGLREHAYEKAPFLNGAQAGNEADEAAVAVLEKTMVGSSGKAADHANFQTDWFYNADEFVVDEDVLWSCTSCGACVQQCPVDIEHVDHIVDMRRYQVLVESNFPAELNGLFKGLENKGNPWNMSATARMDWAKDLPFDVKVVGDDIESLEEVEWLFWVGCAGAYEDRAKKTTRAVAELLDMAGVTFGVLGNGETCTGDSARRAGNEFVFQGLAQQNVETFKDYKVKKVVSTCAHCFNTLRNEYQEFGIELEVVHHTQLLNRLVREGKLTPIKEGAGAASRTITYHDPCYLGRHNNVYEPPRELLEILPGAKFAEMERSGSRSFCCGAGGARMWMEEKIGERINVNRTKEAVATGADQIAVGCPFCRVMLADGLTAEQSSGNAREEVEVLDVAQMLLASVKGESATRAKAGSPAATAAKAEAKAAPVVPAAEPAGEAPATGAAGAAAAGGSLFDSPAGEAAAPASEQPTGGSLFDAAPAAPAEPAVGGSLFDTPAPAAAPAEDKPAAGGSLFDTPAPAAAPAEEKPAAGGSLFDVAPTEPAPAMPAAPAADAAASSIPAGSLFDVAPQQPVAEGPAAPAAAEAPREGNQPASSIPAGSLFDVPAPEAPAAEAPATPATTPAADAGPTPASSIPPGSLFDVPAPVAPAAADTPAAPADPAPATPAADAGPTPASSIPPGSLFDVPAPVAPAAAEPVAAETAAPTSADSAPDTILDDGPAEVAAPSAASDPAQTEPTPVANFDTEASLFDIPAPGAPAETASATVEPPVEEPAVSEPVSEPAAEPVSEAEPAVEPEASTPTASSADSVDEAPDTILDDKPSESPAEPSAAPAPAPAGPAAPAADSGDLHQPKTDVDIHGSNSLFDF